MRARLFMASIVLLAGCAHAPAAPEPDSPQWVSIFNGKDLTGWTPKITHYPLGENFADTFRVEDGVIKVSYDGYDGQFNDRFGHLYYTVPQTYYRLRLEYRFTGEQFPGGPTWGALNSGILFHAQPLDTIPLDQFFPNSIEAQFLGEGAHAPVTGNVCTPETSVVIGGERVHEHCILSPIAAPPAGEWVTFELDVDPDGTVRHFVNGQLAIEYSGAERDEDVPWAENRAVTSGYFSIQSESHPVEFRNIELMVLDETS